MRRVRLLLLVALAVLSTWPVVAQRGGLGYYRFPALAGDTIVFTAEGDLWRVPVTGGVAQRLTTHPSVEGRPAISPDGRVVAYSASYEGPTEVYTLPLDGGTPERHTWDGSAAAVVNWTPDGAILYATRVHSTLPDVQLVRLDPASNATRLVPLAQAADGAYASDGRTLFFTRLPFQGSHTRRYRGGTAQSIYRFTEGGGEAVALTKDYPGTSKTPMPWNGRVYFVSDRDGTGNLWSMAPDGGDLRQHTRHADYEVQSPSLSAGRIVYQHGADLRVYDVAQHADRAVPVTLVSDFDHLRERWVTDPADWINAAHLSPDGSRVVLTARGRVFVAPSVQGRLVEATPGGGVRYRSARFLDDGTLLTLSDRSGEIEFWTLPASGIGEPRQLTTDSRVLRWDGVPSPDAARVAHYDKDQQLWVLDVKSGAQTKVAANPTGDFDDLRWSPDGRWLAFTAPEPNLMTRLFLYEVASGTVTPVTTDRYDSYSPVFSPDGRWLYFLSDRHFESTVGSPWGSRQPDPFFDKQTRAYHVALVPGERSPFAPADELHPAEEKPDDKDKPADKGAAAKDAKAKPASGADAAKKETPKPVPVDLGGIQARLLDVPLDPGNYSQLEHDGKRLYFVDRASGPGGKRALKTLAIERTSPKPETFAEDINGYELSADRKKILLRKGSALHVVDAGAKAPGELAKHAVPLKDWTFRVVPREEWRQMFVDAWRLERDYFYDRAMHGVDWPAMRAKYEPLVARVTDRDELSDVLAQMVAELSALHIFVGGGDLRRADDDVRPASLGARLERDQAAGGWRVAHVYASDPDVPAEVAPLARPGVDVGVGDVITRVNGEDALAAPHVNALLRAQAGRQVLLQVKPKAGGPPRDVVVEPISQDRENDLRYDEWEYTRRLEVERRSGHRFGYLHLRAMGRQNIAEWQREFYPVFNREGLILDVRHNRGGNIDSWLLGKLLRQAWFYWQPRVGHPIWNMQYAFRGHMVVLVNEYTASDGEAFAEGFRRLGMGKVIGTRTWGGEIWLSSSNVLVDRGIATAAEIGVYGPEGQWLIEGHGVDPDIVVDNPPHERFNGRDAQLEAAIAHLEALLKAKPVPVPAPPPYPDKRVPTSDSPEARRAPAPGR